MLILFDDFGWEGPYAGQVKNVLQRQAPNVPIIDLMHDVPEFEPRGAGYLLAALTAEFSPGDIFICVVDPGVGSTRGALIVKADGRWFVGPDNGLLDAVMRRATQFNCWQIVWRPERLSASFHGRDLFAPVAARLATGDTPGQIGCEPLIHKTADVPSDWPRVIYIDHFGNIITGVRAHRVRHNKTIAVGGYIITYARTFSDAKKGEAFWYENSNGLVEIAVNQGYADDELEIEIGDIIEPQMV
ncbi:MAG TPA: SAM-dependent chlorinase/fluorinase [Gammaproteobacteria bacterium]|nr:SAM-dependent chlorinase/fluorinase [Gammaproteobacteria bacterium]